MRPVLLQMNGFVSFRDSETINFTDADFFVLVGPTGSGKSTVIDALVFALSGTVPRWADRKRVSFGLAPTATRGTVRLIFDLDGRRYVVARELRRAASGGVQITTASLERFDDPGATGGVDDTTEVLAERSGVNAKVEQLLGLTYDHFCQCVVLPQGAFADFLHATGTERRAILLKLLGADLYTDIGRAANARAGQAATRAGMLGEQLAELADATEQAERAAAERESGLAALADTVDAALPRLAASQSALDEALRAHRRITDEHAQLAAVQVPAGAAELGEKIAASHHAADAARTGEQAAVTADSTARSALAAAPPRGPLEQTRAQHAEYARVMAALPAARTDAENGVAHLDQAASACQAAAGELEVARDARTAAEQDKSRADAAASQLAGEIELLEQVRMPNGVDALDEQVRAAQEAHERAAAALVDAEQADEHARAALESAPPRAPLERALEDLAALANATSALGPLETDEQAAATAHEQAERALADAQTALESAESTRREAAVAHQAAALRPHLAVGENCPVCEQTVATLPPAAHAPELHAATAAVDAARGRVATARTAETTAARAAATAAAQAGAARSALARLRSQLADHSDEATIRATLAHLDELSGQARAAGQDLKVARRHLAGALADQQREAARADAVRAALRTSRDPLVALGAPTLDDSDLLAAWTQLTGWAQQQTKVRRTALTEAQKTAATATESLDHAVAAFDTAQTQVAAARATETQATAARERAAAHLDELERDLRELTAALADAPSDADAAAQLAELDRLAEVAAVADTALRAARMIRERADAAAERLAREHASAWQQLRATRDPLFPLGAPELPEGQPVLTGWTALLKWAGAQATARTQAFPAAQEAVASATQTRDGATKELLDELAAHEVPVEPGRELGSAAPVAVATALTQARGERHRLAERRARAGQVREQLAAAQDQHQVAKELGRLLRSDQFPEWLEAAALDTLLLDASARLLTLSGGQFELTHRGGDFFVVDHADADSLRSVRTLSGGETFQASLALALALSRQLSALAASGAVRLDSIFLDEGFGTLDPDTLEVVAGTLETLATDDRMVGVITHVAALAERIPVRFTVSRDSRGSHVVRESA